MTPELPFLAQALPYLATAFVAGYLSGSVPFGLLITKAFGLGDIRQVGSGNIGTSNVLRSGNKLAALLTLLGDLVKGLLPTLLMLMIWGPLAGTAAGLGAVLGHCFSVWLRFHGGKGVATAFGVLIAWHWSTAVLSFGGWLLVAAMFRYTSLAALVSCLIVPALLLWFREFDYLVPSLMLVIVVIFRHATNIRALLKGQERKLTFKSRPQ